MVRLILNRIMCKSLRYGERFVLFTDVQVGRRRAQDLDFILPEDQFGSGLERSRSAGVDVGFHAKRWTFIPEEAWSAPLVERLDR